MSTVDTGSRRSVVALVAAAGVVVVVFVIVLVFGVARPPALEHVADEPGEPGVAVAWSSWTESGMCVHVARSDGEVEQVYCDRQGGEVVEWTAEGIHLRTWTSGADLELVIDPSTGEVVTRGSVDGEWGPEYHESVRSRHADGRLVVELEATGTVLWEVEAPQNYTVDLGRVSPDGRWVAMTDSASRLLIVPEDGSAAPRVWVEDFDRWQLVVWAPGGDAVG